MTSSPTPHAPVPAALLTDGVVRPNAAEPGRRDAFLPVAAVQNHAANLARLPGGALGCVWFGGTQEGVPDISVWYSRLEPGAQVWTDPVQLSNDPTRSEQNPVLFAAPGGAVWLLHTAQRAGNQDTAEVRRRISLDGGRSWGPSETFLPADEKGGVFVRQPIAVTRSGRWILPLFRCVTPSAGRWVGDLDTSSALVSDDAGATWREIAVPDSVGAVHMNVHELPDGRLRALFRSRWADHVYSSESVDDGASWTPPRPLELPNNNSSVQFVVLGDGRLALVCNASSAADATERRLSLYDEIDDEGLAEDTGDRRHEEPAAAEESGGRTAFWGAPRAPMTLAISSDGGETWPLRRDLDRGDGYALSNNSRDGLNREFSYPSIAEAPDGGLDIAYTYFRQAIKYSRVSLDWVDGA